MELADREHGGIERIDPARHDGLQGQNDMGAHDDGVDGRLWPCRMAADAIDVNCELIRRRIDVAGDRRELADRYGEIVMGAEDHVARKPVEQALLDHDAAAARPFLRRLEDEVDGAVEILGLREIACGAKEHRRMPVMPASVHLAGIDGLVGEVGLLLDRQRVHVGADADRARAGAAAQGADDARMRDPARDLDAPGGELLSHDVAGAVLLEAELRMGVDIAPPFREVVAERGDAIVNRHLDRSFCPGIPYEIRTRVTAVKGRCPRPLDERDEAFPATPSREARGRPGRAG